MSTSTKQGADALIQKTHKDGVTTLTMNNPKRLNGWTAGMMEALKASLAEAAQDDATKVVILTGAGKYYSAGVNLSGTLSLSHPRKLHRMIIEHNQGLFEVFLDFPKPILVAVNGPAIGATVTSATLCDAIIAAEEATFSTPFAALGITPEGCSSVMFAQLMGEDNAARMLGKEGWKPSAQEAKDAGLIHEVTSAASLMSRAQAMAEEWVAEGKARSFRGGFSLETLKQVNAEESVRLADAFLAKPFLKGQADFLWRKKKRVPAMMFYSLWASHPLWSRML